MLFIDYLLVMNAAAAIHVSFNDFFVVHVQFLEKS